MLSLFIEAECSALPFIFPEYVVLLFVCFASHKMLLIDLLKLPHPIWTEECILTPLVAGQILFECRAVSEMCIQMDS